MKCSWAAERSLSSEARHLAMNSPGVMALGSGVGMVVSWVFLVLPAGGVRESRPVTPTSEDILVQVSPSLIGLLDQRQLP